MKNPIKIVVMTIIGFSMVACSPDKKAEQSLEEYEKFVLDHRENPDQYYEKEWSNIETDYMDAVRKAEEHMSEWDDQMKARYEYSRMEWETFKENYLAEANKLNDTAGTEMIVASLFPPGINEDMSNVDNGNILEVHKHFVTSVDGLKDNLTREQWDHVEILWERLGTRKNQLEKDMKSDVKMALAEQKVVYASIKVANRPVAKGEENADAKGNDNADVKDNEKNK